MKIRDSVKVLGDLKWNGQVDHMLSSANIKLFALCWLNKFGVRELVIVYTGYVLPVLSLLTTDQVKRLESVQKRVCKIILDQ